MKQVGRVTVDIERPLRSQDRWRVWPCSEVTFAWPWEGRSRAGPVQGDVQVWWQEVEVVPV